MGRVRFASAEEFLLELVLRCHPNLLIVPKEMQLDWVRSLLTNKSFIIGDPVLRDFIAFTRWCFGLEGSQ